MNLVILGLLIFGVFSTSLVSMEGIIEVHGESDQEKLWNILQCDKNQDPENCYCFNFKGTDLCRSNLDLYPPNCFNATNDFTCNKIPSYYPKCIQESGENLCNFVSEDVLTKWDPDHDGLFEFGDCEYEPENFNGFMDFDGCSGPDDDYKILYKDKPEYNPPRACWPTVLRIEFYLDRIDKIDKIAGTFDAKFLLNLEMEIDPRGDDVLQKFNLTDMKHFPLQFTNKKGELIEKKFGETIIGHYAEYEGTFFGEYDYSNYPFEKLQFPIEMEAYPNSDCRIVYSNNSVFSGNDSEQGQSGIRLKDPINSIESISLLKEYPNIPKDEHNRLNYTAWTKSTVTFEAEDDKVLGFLTKIFPIMLMTSLAVIVFWLPKEPMIKIELNALFLVSMVFFTQLTQTENSFITYFTNYDTVIISSFVVFLVSITIPALQLKVKKMEKSIDEEKHINQRGRIGMIVTIVLAVVISVLGYLGPF